jgi:hypothetical protein
MAHEGFAAFYASSYRRLLGQLFAVTGDLAEVPERFHEPAGEAEPAMAEAERTS